MANTRSRALKAKQPTKKTLAAKRKADVLADDVEADADSTLDLDEDIIKKAKQLIADSHRYEDQKREEHQTLFLEKMKDIRLRVPGMFDDRERSLKIQTILTELRVKVQRSQEIDQQLTQLSKELSKLIRHAQRSIDGAIEMKLDDLDRLGQELQGEEGQEHAPETS